MQSQAAPSGRRGQGKRAGINLALIVESARSLAPRAMTMQAVADDLGVDRKTINHYVRDRDALLRLVALEAFADGTEKYRVPADASWQQACRAYALVLAETMIAAGEFADHLRVHSTLISRFVGPTEDLFGRMFSAGFSEEVAVRSLALLSNLCIAYARDVVFTSPDGELPRPEMLREGTAHDPSTYPNLVRVASAAVNTYDRRQLEMSVEIFIEGLATVRARDVTPD